MTDDAERAWKFCHEQECFGGAEFGVCRVSSDPQDIGGDTIHGIARRFNPEAWTNAPPDRNRAGEIFYDLYWRPAGCHRLAWPLSLAVADFAFNSGVGRAKRFLARVMVSTGSTDPQTIALALIAERRTFLQRLRTFAHFGRGWMARCARLEAVVRAA